MRALVTGASGFVGTHLVRHLLEEGDHVLGTYIPIMGQEPFARVEGCEYTRCDISDYEAVAKIVSAFRPDAVYHLAGLAFVPEAEENFNRTLLINVGGVSNVVRACHVLQLGTTMLFVSSAEVYGRFTGNDLPLTEESAVWPLSNYSLSKLMGEMVLQRYAHFGYVRPLIIRPLNHIGPGQDERFVVASFARQLSRIARKEAPPSIHVGNLEVQRDFTDVRDVVRAYRLAVLRGTGLYNLCSGKPTPVRTMLDTLIAISGLDVEVVQDSGRMRPSDTPIVYGSYEKARREFGWEPQYTLEQTLRDTYADALKR